MVYERKSAVISYLSDAVIGGFMENLEEQIKKTQDRMVIRLVASLVMASSIAFFAAAVFYLFSEIVGLSTTSSFAIVGGITLLLGIFLWIFQGKKSERRSNIYER